MLLRSDWDDRYRRGHDGSAYGQDVLVTGSEGGWPAAPPEAIEWLCERGIRCLGTDGLSVGAAEDGTPAHLAGLGMTFLEALTGLRQLPATGAWFLFLPLKLVDGTGGPGRAIAVLPG